MTERPQQSRKASPDYNELDRTDESLKAEDIARAGGAGQSGDAGESAGPVGDPRAPDGRSAERYAG